MKTNLIAIYHHPVMKPMHEAISLQDHRTLVLWSLETGKEILDIFTRVFPEDNRPTMALAAAEAWSRGEIKMPVAKKAARETHQAAKDAKTQSDAAVAAAHAMGQIIGVVQVATHSPAYAAYAVQAMVLLHSKGDPEEALIEAVNHLSERLTYWASVQKDNRPWASFL